jgi:hypothetical protein
MCLIRGQCFTHKHWLNPETMKPLRCVVTAIRQGVTYYRPKYGVHDDGSPWLGAPAYFPTNDWPKYVDTNNTED